MLRHRDGAQERLQMKAVRHLHGLGQVVGQAIGAQRVRGDENGQAVGLRAPELVIVHQVVKLFLDRPDRALGHADLFELRNGIVGQLLQPRARGVDMLRLGRGLQIDADQRLRRGRRRAC
jgi:hypothetical protein